MLLTLLAVIYITMICQAYGYLLFYILSKFGRQSPVLQQPFFITCFSGLALVAIVFTTISLFVPLGTFPVQIVLLLPCLVLLYRKRRSVGAFFAVQKWKDSFSIPAFIAAGAAILCILVIHAGEVNHPDTLAYHAPNIYWAAHFPVIPGVAHLNINYGTQSAWFILCALFSFSFTGTPALTFVNAAVLIWFVVFILQKTDRSIREQKTSAGLLWLLLLAVACWSYTQLRLTASSASPDFIAALYIWLILYLFFRIENVSRAFLLLLLFLGFFAMTIKLSALPCLLPPLYAWFRYQGQKKVSTILLPVLTGLFTLFPYLFRNIISTGYLIYPSAIPDFFTMDWKIKKEELLLFKQYISGYAKTHVAYSRREIEAVTNMSASEWLPVWWRLQSIADKVLLLSVPFLSLCVLIFYKKVFTKVNKHFLISLVFCLAGLIFWFVQAPDPRFGFGFLVPFSGLLLYALLNGNKILLQKQWLSYGIILFSVVILSYTAYRCIYFLGAKNIITPAGVSPVAYKEIVCDGMKINIPDHGLECGSTPAPCSTAPCGKFVWRGTTVEEGFKSK